MALAVAVVCAGGSAVAAPRNACTVLTDDAGDTTPSAQTGGLVPADPALDLREVRLQTDRGVMHVAIGIGAGGVRTGDRSWSLNLSDGERSYSAFALEAVDGDGFYVFGPGDDTVEPYRGRTTGRIDLAQGRITIDVPLRQLDLSSRARFYEFVAEASVSVGDTAPLAPDSAWNSVTPVPADQAHGTRSYYVDHGCR